MLNTNYLEIYSTFSDMTSGLQEPFISILYDIVCIIADIIPTDLANVYGKKPVSAIGKY